MLLSGAAEAWSLPLRRRRLMCEPNEEEAMKLIRFAYWRTGNVVELPTGPYVLDVVASVGKRPTVRTGRMMKYLAMILAAVIMLAGARASDAAVRIGHDRGGRIKAYVDKYQGLRTSGEMVIIDGFCASACTIVLGSVPHDKICVTSRAKLGFHAAWNPGSGGRKITDPDATQTLYSMYPFEVRRWIDQRGGLSPRMIFLSGRELVAMYRPCYLDARASSH
jgi:hypothetical protein